MNNLNPAEAAHMNKVGQPILYVIFLYSCAVTNLQSISCDYQIIEKKQMQDFMKLYSGLVERCFNTCITDFTSKALTGREVSLESLPKPASVYSETHLGMFTCYALYPR
jgi:hypothetical protein